MTPRAPCVRALRPVHRMRVCTMTLEALRQNSILKEIYLGGNSIGDEGAKALAEANEQMPISCISLYDNIMFDQ